MKRKRKIPNYEDKVLEKDKLKRLKRLNTDIAKGLIKTDKGGQEDDGK